MSQLQSVSSQDQLIQFLYEKKNICNWANIASQVSIKTGTKRTIQQCKERYLFVFKPKIQKGWKVHEERQLYKLHDKYGNKWATIANHFLGRTDNCVKNHLYSKLRKSLRTLNKIVRTSFKKQLKEISTTVLYKLTEATQQSFNKQPGVQNQLILFSQKLKTGLLQYQLDEGDILKINDFKRQKQFIQQLLAFNKDYKKKTKKDKIVTSYTQNIKKALQKKRQIYQKNDQYEVKSEYHSTQKISGKSCYKNFIQSQLESQFSRNQNFSQYSYNCSQNPYHTTQKKVRKLKNLLIKTPTIQQQKQLKQPIKQKSCAVQEQLKIQGILQNCDNMPTLIKDYASQRSSSRRSLSSRRSFSNVQDSSNVDMLEDNIFPVNFKQYSEMENDSQIFQRNQP